MKDLFSLYLCMCVCVQIMNSLWIWCQRAQSAFMVPIMSLFDTSFLIWSVRIHEKIMTSLASFVSHLLSLGEKKCVLCLLRLVKRTPSLTCDTLFTWSALFPFVPSCALERASFFLQWALNERLWEVVVLPQGRPCSTLVRVCYATAITAEDKENFSGWCLKGLSELCFERRRRMMKMMAGYLCFQKYLTSVEQDQCEYYIKVFFFVCAFET